MMEQMKTSVYSGICILFNQEILWISVCEALETLAADEAEANFRFRKEWLTLNTIL